MMLTPWALEGLGRYTGDPFGILQLRTPLEENGGFLVNSHKIRQRYPMSLPNGR